MDQLRASLLSLTATPDRALLTFMIGMLLVYRELARPGRVLPGVLGAVAAVTALWGILDYRLNPGGVVVLLAATGLVVLQAFGRWGWIPGILGALLSAAGARMLIHPPAHVSWPVALLAIPFSGFTVFLLRIAVIARRNKVGDSRIRLGKT